MMPNKSQSKHQSPRKKEIVGEVFAPLTTEEFDAGMSKGIDYFNRGLYYEAKDEFQWLYNGKWNNMNEGQRQYLSDYLSGTRAKIAEMNPSTCNKEYKDLGWVYSCYKKQGVFWENRYRDYCYIIPAFNSNSANIKNLNAKIYSDLNRNINEAVGYIKDCNAMNIPFTPGLIKSDYFASEYNNYVSIVAEQYYDYGWSEYFAYSINIVDGREITNKELIQKTGYSENDFLNILGNFMMNEFYNRNHLNTTSKYDNENYYKQQNKVRTKKYCNINLPMYVNSSGYLVVYAPVPSVAGADSYAREINTGLMVY